MRVSILLVPCFSTIVSSGLHYFCIHFEKKQFRLSFPRTDFSTFPEILGKFILFELLESSHLPPLITFQQSQQEYPSVCQIVENLSIDNRKCQL